jgi:protoheme IX farnesyltransferase
MKQFKQYYYLTKPGIIRGNLMTALAGFLFGSRGDIQIVELIATMAGLGAVIASGCVFNNYIDRGIDKKMARTDKRALVTGEISGKQALIFATLLGVGGALLLNVFTNYTTLLVALAGHFFYVVVYGYWKRRSVYGTLVGSISGAIPPVVGYVAATNQLDLPALLLFIILASWQMPHFYAIAMYRRDDYKAADIPVLAVKAGMETSRKHILSYQVLFLAAVASLGILGFAGYSYLVVMLLAALWWLWQGLNASDKELVVWAKGIFKVSLVVLTLFSLMISLDTWLP